VTRLLDNAGEMAARHSSTRLTEAVKQGRAELAPWADCSTVRELDDRLTTLRRGVKRCWMAKISRSLTQRRGYASGP